MKHGAFILVIAAQNDMVGGEAPYGGFGIMDTQREVTKHVEWSPVAAVMPPATPRSF